MSLLNKPAEPIWQVYPYLCIGRNLLIKPSGAGRGCRRSPRWHFTPCPSSFLWTATAFQSNTGLGVMRECVGTSCCPQSTSDLWGINSRSASSLFTQTQWLGVVHYVKYIADFPFIWMGSGIRSDFDAEFRRQNPSTIKTPLFMGSSLMAL